MKRNTLDNLIVENMKTILGFSISRLQNMQEAEELASEIVYKLLVSGRNLRDEAKFYPFMWRVSENTYADYLRGKSKRKYEEISENLTDENFSPDDFILKEEMTRLRRELSLLSDQYRECTVLYYINNLNCRQISERLSISMEMVKYYLFRARKIIREGINLNRTLGEKSYNPVRFEIDFWGTKAGDDNEYRSFRERKIRGNILLAAYYTPISAQELSIELGVAMPYLEDELCLLEKSQYLIIKNGKYLTNIPIFTLECRKEIDSRVRVAVKKAVDAFHHVSDEAFVDHFANRFKDENLLRWQMIMLYSHFAMLQAENKFSELPSDGAYSLVNGGGGKGFIWGRCITDEKSEHEIKGIYNNCPSHDGRGRGIAFNFKQIVHAQHFQANMIDPISCTGVGCFAYLPDDCRSWITKLGYEKNGSPNFPVYTDGEYRKLPDKLMSGIKIFTELFNKTGMIAAEVTAQHSPEHIRKNAEKVGDFTYKFYSIAKIVEELYREHWLKAVDKSDKPAMCLITPFKNI